MTIAIVIGTRNAGKFDEIKTILGDLPFELLSLNDFKEAGTAKECGDSYAANAIIKAQYYAAATGLITLADDSGLEVTALNGAPGVFSARYAGEGASDQDRRELLLSELSISTNRTRAARFVSVVAIADPDQKVLKVTEGVCAGVIAEGPRGVGGFGYDPIFVPEGYDQTFAELPQSIKNEVSHRAHALLMMKDFLAFEVGRLDQSFSAS